MENIPALIDGLQDRNANQAYACLKQLIGISECTADVYPFFDVFAKLLSHPSSYVRTRGLLLIAANAKWDVDYKIDEIIDAYLTHITDDKPITARQFIKVLPSLAKEKPDLRPDIESALLRANPGRYPGSMQPLVEKDIQNALRDIRGLS